MKRYIQSARYVNYDGKLLRVNDGESGLNAINRYKTQLAEEEANRLESERLAKEEARLAKEAKEAERAEKRKIPKYKDHTIVLTKDGEYYQVFDGYYFQPYDTVMYSAMPCSPDGKWDYYEDEDDYRWSDVPTELDQRDIQRKIR